MGVKMFKIANYVFLLMLIAMGSSFAAERQLTGAEITEFLPTIRANGSNSSQTFEASGATDYNSAGRPTIGQWRVEGDKYCSVWPPVTIWKCYGVVVDKEKKRIFWVEENGVREKNRYEIR